MRILHTADWHLGRTLYGKKRYEEFTAFLDWLIQTIEQQEIDLLLIAGDIFDTNTPSNGAQELYYRFLCRVAASCCHNIVVIGGNHDSPSFLNAPKELLRVLNVHVIGAMTENLADEVIVINNNNNNDTEATSQNLKLETENNKSQNSQINNPINNQINNIIICAVPYLRDKDIRTVEPGETIDDKNRKLVAGIKEHYQQVAQIAEQKRTELTEQLKQQRQQQPSNHPPIPIFAMGHLFSSGGKTADGDGVRELYVGSLAHVGADIFPPSIDYLALGHLHIPQTVGANEHIRYSGSPIPMGYGEANHQKSVVIIDIISPTKTDKPPLTPLKTTTNTNINITLKKIPCFQPLVRIVGTLEEIQNKIAELEQQQSHAWLEIEYTGNEIINDLRNLLSETLVDTNMEIRRIKNKQLMEQVMDSVLENETLDELDTNVVFERCLDAFDIHDRERQELIYSYNEIIKSIAEEDTNAS